jgi:hypothetical protein
MKLLLTALLFTAFAASTAFAAPATCPQAGEQLSEALASARQRIVRDGEVRAEFEVDARGRTHLLAMEGTHNYRAPVRLALDVLTCQPGTPQRYVLNIRFADRAPTLALVPTPSPAASAIFAEAGR